MSLRKWLELTVHTIFPIKLTIKYQNTISESVAYRGGGGGFNPPPEIPMAL